MSVPQYLRQISLKVGDADDALDLSDMRIRFAVRRGDFKTPNSADIRVYNLSENTVQRIQKEFERVVLQAGYAGNYGVIFDGTIKQVRRGRESQDTTYIDITAADGDSAYNFAVMNVTLASGSTANDHLEQVLSSMKSRGITMGEAPELSETRLPRGKVFYGMTRDFLDILGKTQDVSWSIQDSKLTLIPNNAYLPGEAVVITSATGMVGLPEQTQNGINVRTLLNPGIRIGKRLQINNTSIQQYRYGLSINSGASNSFVKQQAKIADDGFYKAIVVDHYGDTRGNEWYTDTICLAIDATVPIGLLPQTGGVGPVGPVRPYG
ncbi:phage protein [Pseudomonas sp. SDO52101_S400]